MVINHELIDLLADRIVTVLVEHGPGVEDHDSAAELASGVALLETVCLVVSAEVALKAQGEGDVLIELVALHLVEIRLAELGES